METSAKPSNTHIGRKISRIRELRGIKQEHLASELGVSQQTVSRMEQAETIEDDVLEKVAGVLGVSAEAIRNYSDEAVIYNIQNNYEGSIIMEHKVITAITEHSILIRLKKSSLYTTKSCPLRTLIGSGKGKERIDEKRQINLMDIKGLL